MITGETVTVIREVEVGRDGYNKPITEEQLEDVDNVLVQPGSREDVAGGVSYGTARGSIRTDGTRVKYTLHFPKTFDKDLRLCDIVVRGTRCHVIGEPDHYILENCPTQWWMPCEVTAVHG